MLLIVDRYWTHDNAFEGSGLTNRKVISQNMSLQGIKLHLSPTHKQEYYKYGWPGSSVGIATDYRLDGPGSNPGGDEIFRPSRPALRSTQPPVKWVPGLSRG